MSDDVGLTRSPPPQPRGLLELPARGAADVTNGSRFNLTVGVVTHVPHWLQPDGRPWAYEPYVRELEIWAKLFRTVNICAPWGVGPMRGNQAPYSAPNIRWHPVTYPQAYTPWSRVGRFVRLPGLAAALYRLIRSSDIVHLRSPGGDARQLGEHPDLVEQARLLRVLSGRAATGSVRAAPRRAGSLAGARLWSR